MLGLKGGGKQGLQTGNKENWGSKRGNGENHTTFGGQHGGRRKNTCQEQWSLTKSEGTETADRVTLEEKTFYTKENQRVRRKVDRKEVTHGSGAGNFSSNSISSSDL